MEVLKIPKRSLDLNVLDYAFWAKVNESRVSSVCVCVTLCVASALVFVRGCPPAIAIQATYFHTRILVNHCSAA